jgi:hypothetical protein
MTEWNKETVSIVEWYQEFNGLYFNNELPDTVPVKWTRSRDKLGSVTVIRTKTGEKSVKYLYISSYYNFTEMQFKSTLLHEMVHVHNFFHSDYMGHGLTFQSKCREIEKLSSIDEISEVKSARNYKLYGKAKDVVGVVAEHNNGSITGMSFTSKALIDDIKLTEFVIRLSMQFKRFKFIRTTDRSISVLPKSRVAKWKFYKLPKENERLFNEKEYTSYNLTRAYRIADKILTESKVA